MKPSRLRAKINWVTKSPPRKKPQTSKFTEEQLIPEPIKIAPKIKEQPIKQILPFRVERVTFSKIIHPKVIDIQNTIYGITVEISRQANPKKRRRLERIKNEMYGILNAM